MRRNNLLISFPVGQGFFMAGLFNRHAPFCQGNLPMTRRPPFRNDVSAVIPTFSNILRKVHNVPINLKTQEINGRATFHHIFHLLFSRPGKHGGRRVIRIDLLDHQSNFIHGIPDFRIGIMQIQLVSNSPGKQSRMILVLHYFFSGIFQLFCHGLRIVVIKTMAFPSDFQPHANHQAVGISLIEQLLACHNMVIRAPCPQGIPSMRRQGFNIAPLKPGPFYKKRLTVTIKHIAIPFFF